MQFGSPEEGIRVVADASPFWMLASVSFLVYLLAVELADRVLVRDELEVARSVQAELLPRGTVEIPGFRVAHGYRTANEVGGDYYDFRCAANGDLLLAIGDATGGHDAVVAYLLNEGANVNAASPNGTTALMMAERPCRKRIR